MRRCRRRTSAGSTTPTSSKTSLLFGVTPADPVTYAGTIALTIAAPIAAAWIPMSRAALVDPVQTLR